MLKTDLVPFRRESVSNINVPECSILTPTCLSQKVKFGPVQEQYKRSRTYGTVQTNTFGF